MQLILHSFVSFSLQQKTTTRFKGPPMVAFYSFSTTLGFRADVHFAFVRSNAAFTLLKNAAKTSYALRQLIAPYYKSQCAVKLICMTHCGVLCGTRGTVT